MPCSNRMYIYTSDGPVWTGSDTLDLNNMSLHKSQGNYPVKIHLTKVLKVLEAMGKCVASMQGKTFEDCFGV